MANSLDPISETAIANMAVSVLDDVFITNMYTDGSTIALFMATNFGYARDEMLRAYPWSFAKAFTTLAQVSSAPTHPSWSYKFQLPGDCLRLIPPRYGNQHEGALVPYQKIGKVIYTNTVDTNSALPITYIKRFTAAGDFDPLFARALGYYLALLAAHGITGKQAYVQKAENLMNGALDKAYLVDSLETGTPERYDTEGDVISVRLGGT